MCLTSSSPSAAQDYARVRIADYHTNICRIEKNGTVLYEVPLLDETVQENARADRSLLNMQDIWDFAETADLRDVADLLERQSATTTPLQKRACWVTTVPTSGGCC